MPSRQPARTLHAACALIGAVAPTAVAAPDPADHVELWYTTGSHQIRGLDTVTNTEINAYNGIMDLSGITFADRPALHVGQF